MQQALAIATNDGAYLPGPTVCGRPLMPGRSRLRVCLRASGRVFVESAGIALSPGCPDTMLSMRDV